MKRKTGLKILIFFLAVLFLTVLFLLSPILSRDRMVWGLKVVNVNIGGLSSFEAKAVLEKETAKIYQKDVILEYSKEDRTWQVTVLDMGFNIDIDNTINNALKIGREGVFKSFSEQASALFFGKNLPLSFNFNSKEFDDFGKINFFEIENYKQEPELKYDVSSSDFIIQPGKTGLMVDKEKLKDDILSQINQGFFSKVELALKKDQPLSQMAAEKTRQKALLILNSAPYYLTDQDKKWPLNKETILSWFFFLAKDDNLVIELKEKEVQSLLEGLVPEVNQPSTNAVLGQKDGQMIIVKEGQNKKELDLKSYPIIFNFPLTSKISPSFINSVITVLTSLSFSCNSLLISMGSTPSFDSNLSIKLRIFCLEVFDILVTSSIIGCSTILCSFISTFEISDNSNFRNFSHDKFTFFTISGKINN